MGRSRFKIFLILCAVWCLSCSKGDLDRNSGEPDTPEPVTKAYEFRWTRSRKDAASSSLRIMWELKGTVAIETGDQKDALTIEIKEPNITHYRTPGIHGERISIQAVNGTFNEVSDSVLFYPVGLLQSFKDGTTTTTMITKELNYDGKKETVSSEESFSIHFRNVRIQGIHVLYELEKNIITFGRETKTLIYRTPGAEKCVVSLPSGLDHYRDFFSFIETHRRRRSISAEKIHNRGKTVYNSDTGILNMAGPVLLTSDVFKVSSDTLMIEREDPSPVMKGNDISFRTIVTKGNVVFQETVGEKRKVTCKDMIYNISGKTAVMTGDPALFSIETIIRSRRITYYADRQTFTFARPFTVTHQSPEKAK